MTAYTPTEGTGKYMATLIREGREINIEVLDAYSGNMFDENGRQSTAKFHTSKVKLMFVF